MHGIAKRGLALVAATSGLVLGTATFAAADATTTADTSHSGGAVAGWAVQAPVNVPVKLCGVNVQAVAIKEMPKGTTCHTGHLGAVAQADADHSGGIVSGDVVQAAANAPILFCGWNVDAVALKDHYEGSTCTADANGPGAVANATADLPTTAVGPPRGGYRVSFGSTSRPKASIHSAWLRPTLCR